MSKKTDQSAETKLWSEIKLNLCLALYFVYDVLVAVTSLFAIYSKEKKRTQLLSYTAFRPHRYKFLLTFILPLYSIVRSHLYGEKMSQITKSGDNPPPRQLYRAFI